VVEDVDGVFVIFCAQLVPGELLLGAWLPESLVLTDMADRTLGF
jgi:hypothetical protein